MQLIKIYRFDNTNFNSITVYTVFFIVKNAALVIIRDFFQKH